MKYSIISLVIMLLISCKTTSQVVLIGSDGTLIHEQKISVTTPLLAVKLNDTVTNLSIDIQRLIVELRNGGFSDTTTNHGTVYPNFQRATATEGQTFFQFIIPKIYFVVKNKVIMDFVDDYTVASNGITFITPAKAGDKIKIINMQPQ